MKRKLLAALLVAVTVSMAACGQKADTPSTPDADGSGDQSGAEVQTFVLGSCGPLTAEDRVFLARHPDRPHIDETISALFTDFFESAATASARKTPPFWAVWRCSTASRSRSSATARALRWKKTSAATSVCRGRRATARPCA